jgi:ankyrin repeat protein
LDVQNNFGDTALIIASRRGDYGVVRTLLTAGASALLRNQDKRTAEDIAEARAFTKVAALLRSS